MDRKPVRLIQSTRGGDREGLHPAHYLGESIWLILNDILALKGWAFSR